MVGGGPRGGLRPVDGGTRAPPPTISFHGADDAINPYHGGEGSRWDIGVEEAGRRYATMQGCMPGHSNQAVIGGRIRQYSTADGVVLTSYDLVGAGHAWPGSANPEHVRIFGPACGPVDASELIVASSQGTWRNTGAGAVSTVALRSRSQAA